MMPTEIDRVKAIIDKKMKEEVIRVLNGETSSVDIYYCRPADIVSYIESIGGSRGDMETHGWEWDFWLEIKYKNQTYTVSGDGYFNNYVVFKGEIDEKKY